MYKIVKVLFLLLCLTVWRDLDAGTVMVYSGEQENISYERFFEVAVLIEEGIMETYFDMGHIVFNAIQVEDEEYYPDGAPEPVSFFTARTGGAEYLVEVLIQVGADDMNIVPDEVVVRLFHLYTDEKIIDQIIDIDRMDYLDGAEDDQICRMIGSAVASLTVNYVGTESW